VNPTEAGANTGTTPLTQITIADMSPRELETPEMVDLLEKVLEYEEN
jgi:hypothetical protein